ncbi:MAG: aspartyl protease family protein, partial [Terriglobales bacterium]
MSRGLLFLVFSLASIDCLAQSNTMPSRTPPAKLDVGAASPSSLATQPAAVPNPLGEAMLLYGKGDYDGALAKYRDFLQLHPKSPDAYAGIIRVYLKQKNVEQAARTADEALAASDAARIRVAHAEVLFRQGKIDEAEKEWVAVINSGHAEARAYLGLARVRRAIAMYKSAQTFIRKAHELDSTDPDIEEQWVSTLPRSERIKYLEEKLAAGGSLDAEERSNAANYLEYLKERAKRSDKPCRLVSKVTSTETPLVRLLSDPRHLRGYGLAVELNGHKSSLMLDTGASGILVKRAIAEKAGISKISTTKVGGVGDKGWKNAYVGVVDSIKVGDLEFQHCPIEVMESRSVADEDGLIGANVFDDFLVDIDFPDEKLKLSALPKRPGEAEQNLALKDEEDSDAESAASPQNSAGSDAKASPAPAGPQDRYISTEMQSYSRVFLFGHHILVPTKIGDVPPKLFILDTGGFT